MKRSFKIILDISLTFLILMCFMFCYPFKIVQADGIYNAMNAASSTLENGKNEAANVWTDEDFDLLNTSVGNFFYTAVVLIVAIADLALVGFYIMQKVGLSIKEPVGLTRFKAVSYVLVISNVVVVGLPLLVGLIDKFFDI